MSKLDEKLLNRIKEDTAMEKTLSSWSKLFKSELEELWPEVCRRYSEEVNKPKDDQIEKLKSTYYKQKNEISQLKKQLEDMEREKHIMDCQIRTFSRVFEEDQRTIVDLKTKLEVKEKPDFRVIAKQKYGHVMIEKWSGYTEGSNDVWNEHVIPRDAAIAERDKEIERLKQSRLASIKASLEKAAKNGKIMQATWIGEKPECLDKVAIDEASITDESNIVIVE